MSSYTNAFQYLIQSQEQPDYNPERDGKIIFLFFSLEKDHYLEWLKSHNRRPETIQSYEAQLNAIAPHVLNNLGSLRFDEIGEDEIFTLMESLNGLCGSSRRSYLATFGRLIEFVTGSNPVTKCQILWDDVEPTHRIFIENKDWPAIKASARSSTDRLILYLGAYMGLRREEMVRIRLGDIQGNMLTIHGKGHGPNGKEAIKEMPEPVRVAMRIYLKERNRIQTDTDRLLIRVDGRQKGKVMNGRSIRFAVDRMVKRCGIKFTPHSLRRLYATNMWEATGKDLALTKRATRHESTDVLMDCYIRANPNAEREAVDRLLKMI